MGTGLFLGSDTNGDDLTSFTRRVEGRGYESLWFPEIFGREVMSTAGWLLASTSTLKVGTAIASVYSRTASIAAMAAHTLAEFSGGRFSLSLGVSVQWLVEQLGGAWETPLTKASSYLDQYLSTDVDSSPPSRPAPLYFAAHGPRIIDAVKDRVDGIMTLNVPPAHTADVRAQLRDDQELIVLKNIIFETDPDQARAEARERVEVFLMARQYWTLWPTYGYDDTDNVGGGSDRLIDITAASPSNPPPAVAPPLWSASRSAHRDLGAHALANSAGSSLARFASGGAARFRHREASHG